MKKKEFLYQCFLTLLFAFICFLVLFPFLLLLSTSFTSEKDLLEYGYKLIPNRFSLAAYRFVFENPLTIYRAYGVTGLFSVVTMILSVFMMSLIAYPLSRRAFIYKRTISFYLYFTMLFNGGLVPTFILITQYLHLDDTLWVYIFPSLITPWYVFMMRTFFQDLPESIFESARLDGAGEMRIYLQMALPLSKPVLATVALFMFLGKWNDWMTSMLYINDERLMSLQYLLQRILERTEMMLQVSESGLGAFADVSNLPTETAKMATAVIVAGPALVVFPFFQKYFVKGLTVGGVKG